MTRKTCAWISTADALPPFGKYVLARHNRGTWISDSDPEGVNYVVVSRQPGNRGETNNTTDYHWRRFGPDSFWGQSITHWMAFEHVEA